MMLQDTLRKTTVVAAAALAMALGAGGALAQPGGHGPHGHGAQGAPGDMMAPASPASGSNPSGATMQLSRNWLSSRTRPFHGDA